MSKIASGFTWSFLEHFFVHALKFVLGVILARIIAPESFGLIIAVQVFISFLMVFVESGFTNALVQKKDRSEEDFDTVFIFNFIVSVFLYGVIFLIAPYIAVFFDESSLIRITRILGLSLIISSTTIVQRAKLTIQLDFKTLTKASLLSTIISGSVALCMAYHQMEVWALVIQTLVGQIVLSVAMISYTRWIPRFVFSKESLKSLFGFGSKLMLNTLITRIYLDLYNVFIGKFYTTSQLAFYNKAFGLAQLPSVSITDVLNRVIYPVECELQDNEEELKKTYYKYLHLTAFISLPLLVLMAVLAKPLIFVLYTEKWIGSSEYLIIFSVNFMFYVLMNQGTTLITAKGYTDELFKTMIIRRIVSFTILLLTIFTSVKAVCLGIVTSSFLEFLIIQYQVNRLFSISIFSQFVIVLDVLICCFVVGIITYYLLFLFESPYMKLFIGGLTGLLLYFGGALFFKMREPVILLSLICKRHNRF